MSIWKRSKDKKQRDSNRVSADDLQSSNNDDDDYDSNEAPSKSEVTIVEKE